MKLKKIVSKLEDLLESKASKQRKKIDAMEKLVKKLREKQDKYAKKLAAAKSDKDKKKFQRKHKIAVKKYAKGAEALATLHAKIKSAS